MANHTIQSGDTLWGIARQYNISVARLKELNGLTASSVLSIGQQLRIADSTPTPQPTSQPTPQYSPEYYTVEIGDSLFSISRRFNTSVNHIMTWNNMDNHVLSLGQRLRVAAPRQNATPPPPPPPPPPAPETYTVVAGDSLFRVSQKTGLSVSEIKRINNMSDGFLRIGQVLYLKDTAVPQNAPPPERQPEKTPSPPPPQEEREIRYTVQAGDSLYRIAMNYNVSVADLKSHNNLGSAALSLGQVLLIPPKRSTSNSSTSSSGGGSSTTTNQTTSQPTSSTNSTSSSSSSGMQRYTVARGDSLYSISRRFSVSVEQIKSANQLASDSLSLGQVLNIPSADYRPSFVAPVAHAVSTPSASALRDMIARRRDIVQLTETNGRTVIGNGISAPVGRGGANRRDDVEKVQRRLIQMQMMAGSADYSQIQQMIAAIERFQQRQRIDWWTANKANLLSSRAFTQGLIAPNDASLEIIRDLSQYEVGFEDSSRRAHKANFTNFVRSGFTESKEGILYAGTAMHDIPLSYYQQAGLSRTFARVLQFVSSNEGNFDAVNSYDKAAFSFGFIQFAGATGNGTLPDAMAFIKHRDPETFERFFGRFGIDVEYTYDERRNRYSPARMVVFSENGELLRDTAAEAELRRDKLLTGVFIRAGHYIEVARLQVLAASAFYVDEALARPISLDVNGVRVDRGKITDFIRSEAGLAVLVDMSVNQGVGGASRLFKNSIEGVARQTNLRTLAQLQNIDERRVILHMNQNNSDSRIKSRTEKVLAQGFSTAKS
ncbi:MAG: LysM peptidoglycan-binding domain-containing protein [Bernardetiaceae bacterium]|nr:LysM peptidoglycan-binding domain-containing protein [Bernardetiaceae bacterium]